MLPFDNVVYKFLEPKDLYNYLQVRKNIKIDKNHLQYIKNYIVIDLYVNICKYWGYSGYQWSVLRHDMVYFDKYHKLSHDLELFLPHNNFQNYKTICSQLGINPSRFVDGDDNLLRQFVSKQNKPPK